MNICSKKQSGFTLVEILVVMGMMTVMLVVVTEVFSNMVASRLESEAISAVANDGRFIQARLNYDLGRASSVTTPAALGEVAGWVVFTTTEGLSAYYLDTGNLIYYNPTHGYNVMNTAGTTVTGFAFQRVGNVGGVETIRMLVSLQATTLGEETQDTLFVTTVGRR